MRYTVGEVIDKLLELSNGDRNMMVRGIRHLHCPQERGTLFEFHNIGMYKIENKWAFPGENPYCIEIVSGANNIKC